MALEEVDSTRRVRWLDPHLHPLSATINQQTVNVGGTKSLFTQHLPTMMDREFGRNNGGDIFRADPSQF